MVKATKPYTTISVPKDVKAQLAVIKGERTWGEFLSEACAEWQYLKRKRTFEELRQLLTEEDLKAIRESSREFRKNFQFR